MHNISNQKIKKSKINGKKFTYKIASGVTGWRQ